MLHGQFPFLLIEEFLIEGCVLNMHKTHDYTPAVKFKKKFLCEKLHNIVGNLCANFYHNIMHGCAENFQFA